MGPTTLPLLDVSNQHVDGLQIPSPVVLGRSWFQTQLESSAVWNGLSTGGFAVSSKLGRTWCEVLAVRVQQQSRVPGCSTRLGSLPRQFSIDPAAEREFVLRDHEQRLQEISPLCTADKPVCLPHPGPRLRGLFWRYSACKPPFQEQPSSAFSEHTAKWDVNSLMVAGWNTQIHGSGEEEVQQSTERARKNKHEWI